MKSFIANKNDSGQRLDKFISKTSSIPRSLMYKYLRTGHIKVNKKKKSGDYVISCGDVISFFVDDSFFSESKDVKPFLSSDLNIVFEDENILVVNKPQGLKSQPDKENEAALSEFVKGYLYSTGQFSTQNEASFSPALCNRLDVNTQGLVIAAKNSESLRIINEKIKNKEIRKLYRCILNGVPKEKSGILEGYILKDRAKNISAIVKDKCEGAQSVKTGYKIIKSNQTHSLAEVELFTGRSHQIRAHMASIGCPIEGDYKYGGGPGVQKLCAFKLVFDFSTDSGILNYLKGKEIGIIPDFSKEV